MAREQAFEQGKPNEDISGLQQVVMVFLPQAIPQHRIRQSKRDIGEMTKEGKIHMADLKFATFHLTVDLRPCFSEQVRFVQLNITA